MDEHAPIAAALAEVGPRLRGIRTRRGVSLSALAEATGISKSTLSRLESGQRRPSLELLLPLAQGVSSRSSWGRDARHRTSPRCRPTHGHPVRGRGSALRCTAPDATT